MFMQRSHVPKIESRALHTYLQALVCPSKGTAVSVSTTGYEARLLCCCTTPKIIMTRPSVRTREGGKSKSRA